MDLLSFIKSNIVILDGAMGTVLQRYGLQPGEKPEKWNLTRGDVITEIHRMYFDAGSNIVNTNTFGLIFLPMKLKVFQRPLLRMQEKRRSFPLNLSRNMWHLI